MGNPPLSSPLCTTCSSSPLLHSPVLLEHPYSLGLNLRSRLLLPLTIKWQRARARPQPLKRPLLDQLDAELLSKQSQQAFEVWGGGELGARTPVT